MPKLEREHWTTVQMVFMYFRGTTDHAICYQGRVGPDIVLDVHGFVDADWDGAPDHRRLQVGMCLAYLEELLVG